MSDIHDEQNVKSLGKTLQRVQRGTAECPSNSTLGSMPQRPEDGASRKNLYTEVGGDMVHSSQKAGTARRPVDKGDTACGPRPTRRSAACAHGAQTHAAANKPRRRPATRRKPDTSHTPRDVAYTERPGQADTAAPGSSRNHERLKPSVVMNGPVCGTFHGSPGQRVLSVPLAEWQAARPGPWGEGHCAPPGGWTRARPVPKGPGG